ncbi:putative qacE-like protein integron orf [Collimonas arenae]|uniref:DUF6232 family protein n=1 Tax=Collimonas arenae TaxID=279058 RepID=UPI00077841D5|nr:DUF6232 family protein [Collimonas arenae]AMP00149.1 putative qacE-like protein integron orf [Collimonas arenae]
MEKTYYTNGKVTVTNSRIVIESQTYAMAGITSVNLKTVKPNRLAPVILAIVGFFIAKSQPTATLWMYLVLIAPWLIWLALQKTQYSILLSSASGEHRALQSKNSQFVRGVVDSINQAIVDRG